ncbi:class I SAM-dependent methyltransferase [Streptomyces sp. NPDC049577]|uniref:class I SAM-dependent methyltransferase n=1 Tax=Streptomyces sp. NPDC049577 TaxID=3155153 RepID=UPI00344122B4
MDQAVPEPPAGRSPQVRACLRGVPETALYTLYHRAAAARRLPGLLHDPLAAEALERCDYPFRQRFGRPSALVCRYLALRARFFDREVARFLALHPGAVVVALGEGLETQFWRVDDGRLRWLTVDLPEVVALRRAVLPHGERQWTAACSVLDPRWREHAVLGEGPVLLLAQGLFPYLRPADVTTLIGACADRFPGGTLAFDTLPPWFAGLSRHGRRLFGLPPMPFGAAPGRLHRLKARLPDVADLRHVPVSGPPYGPCRAWAALEAVMRHGHRVPVVDRALPANVRVEFRSRAARDVPP